MSKQTSKATFQFVLKIMKSTVNILSVIFILIVVVIQRTAQDEGKKKKCAPVPCTADCNNKEQKALKEKGECYTCKCKCGARSGEICEVGSWCLKTKEGSKSKERLCCPTSVLTDSCENPKPKKPKNGGPDGEEQKPDDENNESTEEGEENGESSGGESNEDDAD